MDNNVFFKGKAIIDEQFNILSVDDELKDFLGDNLVNTKIARLIHPSDINQLETAVKNVQSESGFVTALRMVDNTGRYRWFVYIIDEAEKMTVQAQNALLKTIEDRPQRRQAPRRPMTPRLNRAQAALEEGEVLRSRFAAQAEEQAEQNDEERED